MRSRVSLIDSQDYELDRVCTAARQCLEPLEGMAAFVKPGERALLMVNLIQARRPEEAVCTHPSLVTAACRLVKEAGGVASVGGSGGGSFSGAKAAYKSTGKILEVAGIAAAAEAEGVELVNFDDEGSQEVDLPGTLSGKLNLAKRALQADVIITLPKMKTHLLNLLTGAVKNHLSLLPGSRKMELHHRFPDAERFGEGLLDIYAALPPRLAIMDAVQGMEGDGPTQGRPRQVGLLAASTDGVALDEVMCAVCGLDSAQVPTQVAARKRGFGVALLGDIDVTGTTVAAARARVAPFTAPMTYRRRWMMRFSSMIFGSGKPSVQVDKCTGCATCARSCPAQAIAVVAKKARIEAGKCVKCFCCHELCPQQAMGIQFPWYVAAAMGRS